MIACANPPLPSPAAAPSIRPGKFLAAFVGLRFADVASTRLILAHGGVEMNPWAAPHAGSFLGLVTSQAPLCAALAAAAILAWFFCESRIRGSAKWIYIPVLAMFAIPVLHNAAVILGLPRPWAAAALFVW